MENMIQGPTNNDIDIIDNNKEEILKRANITFNKVGSVSRFGGSDYKCFTIRYLNTSNVWWTYKFTITKIDKAVIINGYPYNDYAASLLNK